MKKRIPFEKSLMPHLGKTAKRAGYYFFDTLQEHGIDLSKEQWLILKKLYENDGQVQNNLAFLTNRCKTSLTRLINTLEKKHYVHRVSSKKDKRVNHVYLTKEGKNVIEKSLPVLQPLISNLQEGITSKEMESTIQVLKKIQENINKYHNNIQ
jgi:DNA-binding MarR family transcriptional regulator